MLPDVKRWMEARLRGDGETYRDASAMRTTARSKEENDRATMGDARRF